MWKWLILFLLLVPLVSADISLVETLKKSYHLGERLDLSFIVLEELSNENAVFRVELLCSNYNLEYFVTLVDIEGGEEIEVSAPELMLSPSIEGVCSISAKLETVEKESIGSFQSESFDVDAIIPIDISLDDLDLLPSEDVNINFVVGSEYSFKYLLSTIVLDTTQYHLNSTDREFSYSISLEEDVASGEHELLVLVADSYGNEAEASFVIDVAAVPTRVDLILEEERFNPGQNMGIKPAVYDQSDKIISGESVDVVLYDPDDKDAFSKTMLSGEESLYKVPQFGVPGTYTFELRSDELEMEKTVFVNVVEEIDINLVDQVVVIKNVGNVRYDKEINVSLVGEGTVYVIDRRVRLDPGETLEMDLSKEAPEGNYEVVIPSAEGLEVLSEGAEIDDDRSLLKKFGQGLASLTGATTVDSGRVGKSFFLFVLFSIITILVVVLVSHMVLKKDIKTVVGRTVEQHKRRTGSLVQSLKRLGREKNKIQDMFQKHVDPTIVRELIKKPESKIQGEKKEITVLFTDIRGFSAISEKTDPWVVVNILNMYFKHMNEYVKKNKGIINKFMGDSIMALYNAPKNDEGHILNAIKTALEMRDELKKLNGKLKEKGINEIEMGIGVNTGEAIIGNVGSDTKMEYTAIGNTVNIAFRLQGKAKADQVLIDEDMYHKVKDRVVVGGLIVLDLKNIAKPVNVYNVLRLR